MYEAAISYLGKQMKSMHVAPEPKPSTQARGLDRQSSKTIMGMVGNWSTPTSTQATAADKEDKVEREVAASHVVVSDKDMIL